MATSLVLTVIGNDRPGLVEALSHTVAEHDGNWIESRMARMAGKFAGIVRVVVAEARLDGLLAGLRELEPRGLKVAVEHAEGGEPEAGFRLMRVQVVGHDHPGIVRDLSRAIARHGANVEELRSEVVEAPMSGECLFRAEAKLRIPAAVRAGELQASLEQTAAGLMVDISIEDHASG